MSTSLFCVSQDPAAKIDMLRHLPYNPNLHPEPSRISPSPYCVTLAWTPCDPPSIRYVGFNESYKYHRQRGALTHKPADLAATTALREALNPGISTGDFVDTKIILCQHRDSSGRVGRPKALYADSHALKTVPHFNDRECTPTFSAFK